MADYLLKYLMEESLQMLKENIKMPKFIGVVLYIKKRIWMLVRLNRPIKRSLQVVFRKANG